MKNECSIVQDMLPLYVENMVSEDTAIFIREHLEKCPDCAFEFESMNTGKKLAEAEAPQREKDAEVIIAVKKKITRKIFKVLAVASSIFVILLSMLLLYTGVSYSVTQDNISLSAKKENGYSYIILEIEPGKSLSFDSKTEDILNDRNEICGQKIILSNLRYHNNFTRNTKSISWGSPLNEDSSYLELVVKLENDTLQISNKE